MKSPTTELPLGAVLALLACLGCASSSNDGGGRRDGSVQADGAIDGGAGECGMEGDACDADGDGCTQDVCRGGECVAGDPVACDDGASCTADACVSTGPTSFRCEQTVRAGCLADGECRSEGDRDPSATCRICDPSRSTMGWSNAEGSCDDGDACTVGDSCRAGNCEGAPRVDDFEPNDDMVAPHGLGGISDGDSYPAGTLEGSIYPEDDVDWFVYVDSDDFGSSIFPRAQLQDVPSGSDYDLCLFVRCQDGSTPSVDCTAGAREDAGGLRGCCSRNGGSADENVRVDHDCDATDDTADVLVRITKADGPPVCDTLYTLLYGDD